MIREMLYNKIIVIYKRLNLIDNNLSIFFLKGVVTQSLIKGGHIKFYKNLMN